MTLRKNIAFSVLDLAPVTEGSTPAEALRNSLDLAQHAEEFGYGRFWVAEHHNMAGIASAVRKSNPQSHMQTWPRLHFKAHPQSGQLSTRYTPCSGQATASAKSQN